MPLASSTRIHTAVSSIHRLPTPTGMVASGYDDGVDQVSQRRQLHDAVRRCRTSGAVDWPGPPSRIVRCAAQIRPGVRIDEDLGDVAFTLRVLGCVRGQEIDPRRAAGAVRRRDRVKRVIGGHLLSGGGDLVVERHRLRSLGDHEQVAVQPAVQRLAVQDHQPGAGQHHQHRRREQPDPEVQSPDPTQHSRVTASCRRHRRVHSHPLGLGALLRASGHCAFMALVAPELAVVPGI